MGKAYYVWIGLQGALIWLDGCVQFEHRLDLWHRLKALVIWTRSLFGWKHSGHAPSSFKHNFLFALSLRKIMEQCLCVCLRSTKQSSVYLADISEAAWHGLIIKCYANTKTHASTFGFGRIPVFSILHFAVSTYVCRVTRQPISYVYTSQKSLEYLVVGVKQCGCYVDYAESSHRLQGSRHSGHGYNPSEMGLCTLSACVTRGVDRSSLQHIGY
jgi:hypothetical protein